MIQAESRAYSQYYFWFDKGITSLNMNKWEEARQDFMKALDIRPKPFLEGGSIWFYDKVEPISEEIRQSNRRMAATWFGVGAAFSGLSKNEATQAYYRAMKLYPDCRNILTFQQRNIANWLKRRYCTL